MSSVLKNKLHVVFLILGGFFIANALLAELIGVKLFSVEKVFGIVPFDWTIFGVEHLGLTMTAGVILWPIVFIMTDIINEYFGIKGVRFLSILTVVIILYGFAMIFFAIWLAPDSWWMNESGKLGSNGVIDNMQLAYQKIFGQGMWIIGASIVAFLLGQLLDVFIFQKIKQKTGEKYLWLRANGSTFISQLLDSYLILMIAFYIGAGWEFPRVLAIGTVNFLYKFGMAIILTPFIYLLHYIIDSFLGHEYAAQVRKEAMTQK